MSGIKIPLLVDKASGTKQINEWLAQVSSSATVPVDFDVEQAKKDIGSLGDEFKDLIRDADAFSGEDNLDALKTSAEQSEEALKKMRGEIANIEAALKETDLNVLDPAKVEALQGQLTGLRGTFRETFETAEASANRYRTALDRVEQNRFFNASRMNEIKGAIGDLKDIFQATGMTLLDLDEKTVELVTSTADLAEKGMSVGAAFGPWGAAIGGVVGAVIGYFSAASKQAEESKKKIDGITKAASEARDKLTSFGELNFSGLITELQKLETQTNKIRDSYDEARKSGILLGNLREQQKELNASQEEQDKTTVLSGQALIDNLEKLSKAGDKAIEKSNEAMSKGPDTLKGVTKGYNDASDKIIEIQGKIDAIKGEVTRITKVQGEGMQANSEDLEFYDKRLQQLTKDMSEATGQADQFAGSIKGFADDKAEKGKKAAEDSAKAQVEWDAFIAAQEKEQREQSNIDLEAWAEAQLKTIEDAKKAEVEFSTSVANLERDQAKEQREAENKALEEWAARELKIIEENKKAEIELEKKAAEEKKKIFDQTAKDYETSLNTVLMPAVNAVTGQLYENIEQGKAAFSGFGTAIKKGISDSLKALGKQFAVQAIAEGAAGLASLALGPVGGMSAAAHFAASAGYAAAALAAGVAGAAVARSANQGQETARPAESPGNGGGFSGGPGNSTRSSFDTEVKAPLVINVYGLPFGVATQRELAVIGGRINEADAAYNNQGGSFAT